MSSRLSDRIATLAPAHRQALEWFQSRRGTVIEWPEPLNGVFLMGRAKGIMVPAGWPYAVSVRQTLNSDYADSTPQLAADGTWIYRYHQEGRNPAERDNFPANRALLECREDDVPVAVLIQKRAKPTALYEVLGLARVGDWSDGFFLLEGYGDAGRLRTGSSLGSKDVDEPYKPIDIADGRRRIDAQIVARQGGRKFRETALKGYSRRCAISECDVEAVLEAAHIVPYLHAGTNVADNGLLLRSDLHTLFDRHRLRIHPKTLTVILHEDLKDSRDYGLLANRKIALPVGIDPKLLGRRFAERAKLFKY